MVKKENPAGWEPSAGFALGQIIPMVTPRSPLEATITRSGAQDTGLPPGGSPAETALPIDSDPITNPAAPGPPMLTASALPYFVNAGPSPIFWASSEKSRSARSILFRWVSRVWSSAAGFTMGRGGQAGSGSDG